MKNKRRFFLIISILVIMVMASRVSAKSLRIFPTKIIQDTTEPTAALSIATNVSSTISYQGLLEENGVPVTGTRDMDFMLHSDEDCIMFVSGYVGISDVPVEDGLFSVQIPFDHSYFTGQQLFLEVDVGSYQIACQEILPVPYALSLRPGAIITTESTEGYASALIGEVSSTTPGVFSTGLRGINNGIGSLGIGVWGSQDGSGWGVYGQVDGNGRGVSGKAEGTNGTGVYGEATGTNGIGVYGVAMQEGGVGVHAQGSGTMGVALKVNSGAIQVYGAGVNTSTPVFIHRATVDNISGTYNQNTTIDNPFTNGDPDAILIITPNWSSAVIPGSVNNPHPVGVNYNDTISKWQVYNLDLAAMTEGASFNVMVVKP